MYSGTTLTPLSGRILGAHQKFDRMARRQLAHLLGEHDHMFPSIREILKFEGLNGPDGIKRKSPAQNEPWHYVNPFDMTDDKLSKIIADHHAELTRALQTQNTAKAAFDAAWLAHAIVDGLTPAHHYPYEAELTKLRGGKGIETRDTFMRKVVMPGSTPGKQLSNNWKMWGPKGLLSTHGFFEFGVASLILPMSFKRSLPEKTHVDEMHEQGVVDFFQRKAREIAALGLYEKYYQTGWTPRLAQQIKRDLAPTILQAISLSWYSAAYAAVKDEQ